VKLVSWFGVGSGVKQGCVLFPFVFIILMYFVLRNTTKAIEEYGIKWEGGTSLALDYAYELGVLD